MKAAKPDTAAAQPFTEVNALTGPEVPQLPKLMSSREDEPCLLCPSTEHTGLPLRPGCGAGAPVPAERQTDGEEA